MIETCDIATTKLWIDAITQWGSALISLFVGAIIAWWLFR